MAFNTSPGAQADSSVQFELGRISANEYWVTTPVGSWELKDVTVSTYDQTVVASRIPTWAVVAAIVTAFFFLIGLLFLLAKEDSISGHVSLTISTTEGHTYTELIPVFSEQSHHDTISRVNYLQSLVAHARARG